MHIAFVNLIIEYYSPQNGGAISTWMMQQAKRLEARGHRVSILTRIGDSRTYDVGEVIPVDRLERHEIPAPRRLWSRLLQNLNRWDWSYYDFYKRSVQKELKRIQPDAVVCFNDLRTPCYVRQVLPDARVWVRLSNEVPTNQRPPYRFKQSLDGYFPVSQYIRDWMDQAYGTNPEHSVVIVNGCDLESFKPAQQNTRPSDGRPLKVLFVGRINYDKGPDLVVDAVHQLKASGHAIDLTVAGSVWWSNSAEHQHDPYFATLRQKMEEAKIQHLGHVGRADMPSLYQSHDVVVMPSRWNEPCGQVQLEAMASGCAVIASRRGGIPEAMGDAGLLIDPDEPNAVEAALRRLLTEPGLLGTQKQHSIEQANSQTWDRVTDLLETALLEKPNAHQS